MGSVRFRLAITAVMATAVALAVAAFVLLSGLRSSMLEQIDDSVADQAWDYVVNISDFESFETAPILNDEETLLVVFDDAGEIWLSNDTGVEVDEILREVPFADSLERLDPLIVDASIDSTSETVGNTSLRAAVTPVFLPEDLDSGEPVLYVIVGRSTDSVDETVTATRNRLLVLFPLLTALVGLLAWWLSGRALQAVDVMRREVDEISAGDLSRRVSEPGGDDEVAHLGSTMNRMLDRLEDSSVRQRRFVSDAAHELRTPLASIAVQLDVDASHPDTADHRSTAAAVRAEVGRMQGMIDSMLQLARADQGRSAATPTLLDLDEIIRVAVARVPKPPDIELDSTAVAPTEVRGDEGSLLRVADNLLANAYRHANSSVEVRVGTDEAGVWLSVDDDGAGVPAESRELIFERFVRLDEARSRDAGGSGLGLALSREIAVSHGGSLAVTDGHLGGARFVLRLPGPGD